MDYESFRPLDGSRDWLSTLILAGSLALVLLCMGCGFDRRANQPAGDELPAPKRALVLPSQDSQYITEHGQPEAERVSEEEARRAMKAAEEFINREGVKFILHEGNSK